MMSIEKELRLKEKVFIIAEIGSNHNGDFETAKQLIIEAAKSGVDAVKFQIYRAEKKILKSAPPFPTVNRSYNSQYERWKALEFTNDQWFELAALAKKNGIMFFSTVCDNETLDELDPIHPIYKLPSGDLTNLHLIKHIVSKGKGIILSTGMSTPTEVDKAVSLIPKDRLILLHCMASYPTDAKDANLINIGRLKSRYKVPVGYSDHTIGITAPIVAVAIGAMLIEKHFTLDKSQPFGDHFISLEPDEMKWMVKETRSVPLMFGKERGEVYVCERDFRRRRQRGLYAKYDIPKGTMIREEHIIPLLPTGESVPAGELLEIIGKKTSKDLKAGAPITRDALNEG